MIKTKKPDEMYIDWGEIDLLVSRAESPPKGAITRKMVEDRYKCSKSTAYILMDKLIKSGKYSRSGYYNGTHNIKCLIPVG